VKAVLMRKFKLHRSENNIVSGSWIDEN